MSRVDVLAVMLDDAHKAKRHRMTVDAEYADDAAEESEAARAAVAEVFAAAHASLTARDLADQLAADDRLRAALAACEPTDTDHNREAVDGLCVEEYDDEQ